MPGGPLVAPAHARADRRRRGIQDGHPVVLHKGPPAVRVREVGRALVHEGRDAVRKGSIDDVGVARDPADVRGAPVDVLVPKVEDELRGRRHADEIASRRVDNALGTARRSRCVQDEEGVRGIHGLRLAERLRLRHRVMPPKVASLLHGDVLSRPPKDDHVADDGKVRDGLVDGTLEGHELPAAVAGIRRHHDG